MHQIASLDIVGPADPGYDAARAAWNLQADQRPAAVAVARTVADVQAAVGYARERDLTVAPQVTGHLAIAMPSLERSLLLKVALDERVVVDPSRRLARVPGGADWESVADAAAVHGLAAMHGSAPDVGVMGYMVGGGLSFYGRRHGLAVNHVRAIEVVTADGELRRVDARSEPDLFWAIRGGGGAFGVVTAMDVGLLEIGAVYAGASFWPVAQAREVLGAWLEWTRTAPPEVSTSARILCLPPIPEVPEPLRAVPVVAIDGVVCERPAEGEGVVAAFRSVGEPIMDEWAIMPPTGILRLHGDPEEPVPAIGNHALLERFDEAALDAFIGVTGEGSGSPLLMAELRQLGGAISEAPEGAGARGSIEGDFAMYAVGMPMGPDAPAAIRGHLAKLLETVGPWRADTVYLNFAEVPEATAERAYPPGVYERLQEVRAAYDPQERFLAPHRIVPRT